MIKLTVDQVSELFEVDKRTVYRWLNMKNKKGLKDLSVESLIYFYVEKVARPQIRLEYLAELKEEGRIRRRPNKKD